MNNDLSNILGRSVNIRKSILMDNIISKFDRPKLRPKLLEVTNNLFKQCKGIYYKTEKIDNVTFNYEKQNLSDFDLNSFYSIFLLNNVDQESMNKFYMLFQNKFNDIENIVKSYMDTDYKTENVYFKNKDILTEEEHNKISTILNKYKLLYKKLSYIFDENISIEILSPNFEYIVIEKYGNNIILDRVCQYNYLKRNLEIQFRTIFEYYFKFSPIFNNKIHIALNLNTAYDIINNNIDLKLNVSNTKIKNDFIYKLSYNKDIDAIHVAKNFWTIVDNKYSNLNNKNIKYNTDYENYKIEINNTHYTHLKNKRKSTL